MNMTLRQKSCLDRYKIARDAFYAMQEKHNQRDFVRTADDVIEYALSESNYRQTAVWFAESFAASL